MPQDYFGSPRRLEVDGIAFDIGFGTVVTEIDPEQWESATLLRVRDVLHQVGDAVALVRHKRGEWVLGQQAYRKAPDGSKQQVEWPSAPPITFSGGGQLPWPWLPDHDDLFRFVGPVVRLAPRDPLLQFLIDSYNRAVSAPDRELLHLYDISEALKKQFKGEDRRQVDPSGTKIRRLGRLANDEPIAQGRHWGAHYRQLRAATTAELEEARDIARELIAAYIAYLDARRDPLQPG